MSDCTTAGERRTDFLIIGSGLAGLYAALLAAQHGTVALVTKSRLDVSSSAWAQGGVAAALGPDDSPSLHAADTMEAGRGLCDPAAIEVLTSEGPACVLDLERLGAAFERDERGLDLGQEGGHGRRRILHAGGGATGNAIVTPLIRRVRDSSRILIYERAAVAALLSDSERCYGALVTDLASGESARFLARSVILATGGLAGIYHSTTSPTTSTGDGIALAYWAGAELMDLEFLQFHPTALHSPTGKSFLISEAIRGEGAYLLNAAGERFMVGQDPQAELAPRDVVAWAIHQEMQKTGAECVFLSLRHLNPELVRHRFSHIYSSCLKHGIDITTDLVPVAPAAHYTIGGVRTDLNARTSLAGLWACGEVACTGVHGANRLASNSLLECAVFARRAVANAVKSASRIVSRAVPRASPNQPSKATPIPPVDYTQRLARLMTNAVGLVRSEISLKQALAEIGEMERAAGESLAFSSRLLVARQVATAALLRTETRGVHRREEFPASDSSWLHHIVLHRNREPRLLSL